MSARIFTAVLQGTILQESVYFLNESIEGNIDLLCYFLKQKIADRKTGFLVTLLPRN